MSNAENKTVESRHGGHRKGAGRPKGARNKVKSPTITPKKRLGGRREGAGRPVNSGPFKQATKAVRIPLRILPLVEELLASEKLPLSPLQHPGLHPLFHTFIIKFLSLYQDANNVTELNSYLAQWIEELETMEALYF